jgi:hypothetical protein
MEHTYHCFPILQTSEQHFASSSLSPSAPSLYRERQPPSPAYPLQPTFIRNLDRSKGLSPNPRTDETPMGRELSPTNEHNALYPLKMNEWLAVDEPNKNYCLDVGTSPRRPSPNILMVEITRGEITTNLNERDLLAKVPVHYPIFV